MVGSDAIDKKYEDSFSSQKNVIEVHPGAEKQSGSALEPSHIGCDRDVIEM